MTARAELSWRRLLPKPASPPVGRAASGRPSHELVLGWLSRECPAPLPAPLRAALSVVAAGFSLAIQASCVGNSRDGVASGGPIWLEPVPAPRRRSPSRLCFGGGPSRERTATGCASAPRPVRTTCSNIQGISASATSHPAASELPALKALYARVSAHVAGEWRHAEVRFTADRIAAEWVYPAASSPGRRAGPAVRMDSGAQRERLSGHDRDGPRPRGCARPDSVGQHSARRRRAAAGPPLGRPNLDSGPGRLVLARQRFRGAARLWRCAADPSPTWRYRRRAGGPSRGRQCPSPSAHRLRISPNRDGSTLFDSGVVSVTRMSRAGAAGRPHAVCDAQHLSTPTARSSAPSSSRQARARRTSARRIEAAFAATVDVHAMAGPLGALCPHAARRRGEPAGRGGPGLRRVRAHTGARAGAAAHRARRAADRRPAC